MDFLEFLWVNCQLEKSSENDEDAIPLDDDVTAHCQFVTFSGISVKFVSTATRRSSDEYSNVHIKVVISKEGKKKEGGAEKGGVEKGAEGLGELGTKMLSEHHFEPSCYELSMPKEIFAGIVQKDVEQFDSSFVGSILRDYDINCDCFESRC